jgi:hypothetical protein
MFCVWAVLCMAGWGRGFLRKPVVYFFVLLASWLSKAWGDLLCCVLYTCVHLYIWGRQLCTLRFHCRALCVCLWHVLNVSLLASGWTGHV